MSIHEPRFSGYEGPCFNEHKESIHTVGNTHFGKVLQGGENLKTREIAAVAAGCMEAVEGQYFPGKIHSLSYLGKLEFALQGHADRVKKRTEKKGWCRFLRHVFGYEPRPPKVIRKALERVQNTMAEIKESRVGEIYRACNIHLKKMEGIGLRKKQLEEAGKRGLEAAQSLEEVERSYNHWCGQMEEVKWWLNEAKGHIDLNLEELQSLGAGDGTAYLSYMRDFYIQKVSGDVERLYVSLKKTLTQD